MSNYLELVDDYVRRFGQLVGTEFDSVIPKGTTAVQRGSATVAIHVLEEHRVLMLLSPVMHLPREENAALYRHLLELNFLSTSDAAFAVDRDQAVVYLRALRRLDGLDFEEFVDLLDTVAGVADRYNAKIRAEFGD